MRGRPPVRLARPTEADTLRAIERDAATAFAELGLTIDDTSALDDAALARSLDAGLLFVAPDRDDVPVGFVCGLPIDGTPDVHLHEIDVRRAHQGRGLGRQLITHLAAASAARGARALTLTTYRDVPFNAPLYRRLGFTELPDHLHPRWLRTLRDHERAAGLDVRPRIAMIRDLERDERRVVATVGCDLTPQTGPPPKRATTVRAP